jgi:hypothetical protein
MNAPKAIHERRKRRPGNAAMRARKPEETSRTPSAMSPIVGLPEYKNARKTGRTVGGTGLEQVTPSLSNFRPRTYLLYW